MSIILNRKFLEKLPDIDLLNLKDYLHKFQITYNSLIDNLTKADLGIQPISDNDNGLSGNTFSVNAFINDAGQWEKTFKDKDSWLLGFDLGLKKFYVKFCASFNDPITWTEIVSILSTNVINNSTITNWNTAYGWGDHASENYFRKLVDTLDDIIDGVTYAKVKGVALDNGYITTLTNNSGVVSAYIDNDNYSLTADYPIYVGGVTKVYQDTGTSFNLEESCVFYWKFYENDNTKDFYDSVNSYHGQLSSAPADTAEISKIGQGNFPRCFEFKSNYFAQATYVGVSDLTEYSIEAWFNLSYTTDANTRAILFRNFISGGTRPFLIISQNQIHYYRAGAKRSFTHSSVLNDGNWHHIVLTSKRNGAFRVYLDGTMIVDALESTKGTVQTITRPYVGSLYNTDYTMRVSNVLFYSSELTSGQVSFRYNGGLGTELLTGYSTIPVSAVGSHRNFFASHLSDINDLAVEGSIEIHGKYYTETSDSDKWETVVDKADKTNVLEKDNTTEYTPTADYHPATKKYVDDSIPTAGDFNHDDLGNIPANDHIDWTISQTPMVIHADNYTGTTYTASDFDIKDLADSTNLKTAWNNKLDNINNESISDLNDVDSYSITEAGKVLKVNATGDGTEWDDSGSAVADLDDVPDSTDRKAITIYTSEPAMGSVPAGQLYIVIPNAV